MKPGLSLISGDESLLPQDGPARLLHGATLDSWRRIWTPIFVDHGDQLNDADFRRQNVVAVFHRGPEILGACMGTRISCEGDWFGHPYLRSFAPDMKKLLESLSEPGRSLLTGEYVFATASAGTFPAAALAMGAIILYFTESDCALFLATPRRDNASASLCGRFGMESAGPMKRFGLDCSVMVLDKTRTEATARLREWAILKKAWSERTDYTAAV